MTSHVIMTGPEVRAIDDGRKTQFRRAMKEQPPKDTERASCVGGVWKFYTGSDFWHSVFPEYDTSAPFKPGAIIHVKETWLPTRGHIPETRDKTYIRYRADDTRLDVAHDMAGAAGDRWRPAATMPPWAARLWLKITRVWVERLQEISEKDAIADGVARWDPEGDDAIVCGSAPAYRALGFNDFLLGWSAQSAFERYWDSLPRNREHPWDSNPWIFAHEFERTECPERK